MIVTPVSEVEGEYFKTWSPSMKSTSSNSCNSKNHIDTRDINSFYPSPVEDSEAFIPNNQPYSFLLVDDNEINLRIFRRMLLKLFPNASVRTVQESASVEISHRTLSHYHLIFLDIEMPIVTGTEIASKVRSSRELDQVGLIAVTTKYLCADLELYEKLGFDFTFRKPVEYPTNYILQKIEQVLQTRCGGRV